jgi:hypothetical protein
MSQQDGRKLNINAGGREAGKLAILIHRIYLVMWGVHARTPEKLRTYTRMPSNLNEPRFRAQCIMI